MLKWLAKKILGTPYILDEGTYAKQNKQKVMMVMNKLLSAYTAHDQRQIVLLSTWLRNRNYKAPTGKDSCRQSITRLNNAP